MNVNNNYRGTAPYSRGNVELFNLSMSRVNQSPAPTPPAGVGGYHHHQQQHYILSSSPQRNPTTANHPNTIGGGVYLPPRVEFGTINSNSTYGGIGGNAAPRSHSAVDRGVQVIGGSNEIGSLPNQPPSSLAAHHHNPTTSANNGSVTARSPSEHHYGGGSSAGPITINAIGSFTNNTTSCATESFIYNAYHDWRQANSLLKINEGRYTREGSIVQRLVAMNMNDNLKSIVAHLDRVLEMVLNDVQGAKVTAPPGSKWADPARRVCTLPTNNTFLFETELDDNILPPLNTTRVVKPPAAFPPPVKARRTTLLGAPLRLGEYTGMNSGAGDDSDNDPTTSQLGKDGNMFVEEHLSLSTLRKRIYTMRYALALIGESPSYCDSGKSVEAQMKLPPSDQQQQQQQLPPVDPSLKSILIQYHSAAHKLNAKVFPAILLVQVENDRSAAQLALHGVDVCSLPFPMLTPTPDGGTCTVRQLGMLFAFIRAAMRDAPTSSPITPEGCVEHLIRTRAKGIPPIPEPKSMLDDIFAILEQRSDRLEITPMQAFIDVQKPLESRTNSESAILLPLAKLLLRDYRRLRGYFSIDMLCMDYPSKYVLECIVRPRTRLRPKEIDFSLDEANLAVQIDLEKEKACAAPGTEVYYIPINDGGEHTMLLCRAIDATDDAEMQGGGRGKRQHGRSVMRMAARNATTTTTVSIGQHQPPVQSSSNTFTPTTAMYAASHTAPSSASSLLHLPQQLDHQHTNINTPTVIGAVPTTTSNTSSTAIGTFLPPQHYALPPNEPMADTNELPTSKSCEPHTLAAPSMVLSAPPTIASTPTTSTTQPQHDQLKQDVPAPTSTPATTTSTSPMTNTTNSARVCDVVVDESDIHRKSFEGIIQLYERLMPASVVDDMLRDALKRQYKFPIEGGVNATSTKFTATSDAATTLPTPSSSSVFMNNPPLVQSAPATVTTIPAATLTSVSVSPIQSTDVVTPVPTVTASSTATPPPPLSTVSTQPAPSNECIISSVVLNAVTSEPPHGLSSVSAKEPSSVEVDGTPAPIEQKQQQQPNPPSSLSRTDEQWKQRLAAIIAPLIDMQHSGGSRGAPAATAAAAANQYIPFASTSRSTNYNALLQPTMARVTRGNNNRPSPTTAQLSALQSYLFDHRTAGPPNLPPGSTTTTTTNHPARNFDTPSPPISTPPDVTQDDGDVVTIGLNIASGGRGGFGATAAVHNTPPAERSPVAVQPLGAMNPTLMTMPPPPPQTTSSIVEPPKAIAQTEVAPLVATTTTITTTPPEVASTTIDTPTAPAATLTAVTKSTPSPTKPLLTPSTPTMITTVVDVDGVGGTALLSRPKPTSPTRMSGSSAAALKRPKVDTRSLREIHRKANAPRTPSVSSSDTFSSSSSEYDNDGSKRGRYTAQKKNNSSAGGGGSGGGGLSLIEELMRNMAIDTPTTTTTVEVEPTLADEPAPASVTPPSTTTTTSEPPSIPQVPEEGVRYVSEVPPLRSSGSTARATASVKVSMIL